VSCVGADGKGMLLVTEAVDEGGSERVLEALIDRFPEAGILAGHFSRHLDPSARPGWANRAELVPLGARKRHLLGPIYARRFADGRIGQARLVVCLAHHGWALSVALPPEARMLCYCAGVPRSLYGRPNLYLRAYQPAIRPVLRAAIPAIRMRHRQLMRLPDRIVTASRYSAAAIAHYHGRESEVVYPPVRTGFFTPARAPKRHFLTVGRLVVQKNLEAAFDAFRELDEELIVVGRGPWQDRLRAIAPANVRFAGRVPDTELRELYRSAHALVCPSVEEFGIVMAEAHACGIPVVAPRAGGACEIVDDPATGILVQSVDAGSLARAVRAVGDRSFDPDACRASAERFSRDRFVDSMERVVADELARTSTPPETAPVSSPVPA
jgi:glycosyltransferase involved in cell wall biosynthesis